MNDCELLHLSVFSDDDDDDDDSDGDDDVVVDDDDDDHDPKLSPSRPTG